MYLVTIDTGTTNTRVGIWKNNSVIAESSRPIGVRSTAITGSTQTLIEGIKSAIDEVLLRAAVRTSDSITYIASGMITSNMGLHEIPHLIAPAGISELAEGMESTVIAEISAQPIWFIPGIKNSHDAVTTANYESMDMMRGEETESIGVINRIGLQGPALVILPGSHSKFVKIDQFNRIEGCITTIAGELLDVITKNTLLAGSLNNQFAETIDQDALLLGANSSAQVGLARSCFSIRVLDMFSHLDANQKANILLGAVLQDDLQAIKNSQALNLNEKTNIIVCGKEILKNAFAVLIKNDPYFTGEISIIDSNEKSLSAQGAIAIAKQRKVI